MSELMGVEQLSVAYWNLRGYWVKGRVPYKVKNGYSDIDVLAYNPRTKDLVISETKVRGEKDEVRVISKNIFDKHGSVIDIFNAKHKSSTLDFIDNIATYFNSDGRKDIAPNVRTLKVELIGNIVIEEEIFGAVKNELEKKLKSSIKDVNLDFSIHTTVDRFCEIISIINSCSTGKRFGDPILDIAREFSRFLDPKIEWAGRNNKMFKDICRKKIVALSEAGFAE